VSSVVFEFASDIVQAALAVILIWCLYRIVAGLFGLGRPAEADSDDFAGSPARRKPRPKSGASSVALAEPDDDE
jgi:hypothetical protein